MMYPNENCGCFGPIVPPTYPYMGSKQCMCDCCNYMHQPTSYNKYPASGPMQENAFMIINATPYLIDNYNVSYGTKVSVSEGIYTRISSRKDVSCINLAGTIDMTDGITTNTTKNTFLCQTIENAYDTLENVLSIQKSTIQFKLYFHVEDAQGGVVYESTTNAYVQKYQFHYTDIHDYFVTSCKQLFLCEIPSLDFQGVYSLILDKIEAYANVIVTKNHATYEMNPYYQFTNNNTKIAVQHDTIDITEPDGAVMIASTNLNWSIAFQANLTTRFKFSFTAFMSNMISSGDTFDIYNSIFYPKQATIDDLKQQVSILTGAVAELQLKVAKLTADFSNFYYTSEEYKKNTHYHEGALVWVTKGTLYQVNENYTTTDDESVTVQEAFDADIAAGKLIPVVSAI